MSDPNQAPLTERRQNPELRALFEEAYARVEACFDPKQTWGGLPLEHFAFRMLREAYPQMSPTRFDCWSAPCCGYTANGIPTRQRQLRRTNSYRKNRGFPIYRKPPCGR